MCIQCRFITKKKKIVRVSIQKIISFSEKRKINATINERENILYLIDKFFVVRDFGENKTKACRLKLVIFIFYSLFL